MSKHIDASMSNIKKKIEKYNELSLNETEKKKEKKRIEKNIKETIKYINELEEDLEQEPRKKGNRRFDKIKKKLDTMINTDIDALTIEEKIDLYLDLKELISWSTSFGKGKIKEIEV